MRPAKFPGIKRWNVDTRWPRGLTPMAEFSPDDKLFAVGSQDSNTRLYDSQTLELKQMLPGVRTPRFFSWHPDGKRLIVDGACWSVDGRLQANRHTPKGAPDPVSVYSPDGTMVASCSRSSLLCLHDLATGKIIEIPLEPEMGLSSAAPVWSPDSQLFVTRHQDMCVRIWNRQGESQGEVEGFAAFKPSFGIDWSPDGEWIGVYDGNKPREIQRIKPNGERGKPIQVANYGVISGFHWSPDGKHIYASGPNTLTVTDLETGMITHQTERENWDGRISHEYAPGLDLSSDGTRILSIEPNLAVLDAKLGLIRDNGFTQTSYKIPSVAWMSTGDGLITNNIGQCDLWSATGEHLSTLASVDVSDRNVGFEAIAASPDGTVALSVQNKNNSGILLGQPGQKLKRIGTGGYRELGWSGSGKYLAAATQSRVDIFDQHGKFLKQIKHSLYVRSLDFAPGSDLLAVLAGTNGETHLGLCSLEEAWQFHSIEKFDKSIPTVEWSPDGKMLKVGVGIYKYTNGKLTPISSVDGNSI